MYKLLARSCQKFVFGRILPNTYFWQSNTLLAASTLELVANIPDIWILAIKHTFGTIVPKVCTWHDIAKREKNARSVFPANFWRRDFSFSLIQLLIHMRLQWNEYKKWLTVNKKRRGAKKEQTFLFLSQGDEDGTRREVEMAGRCTIPSAPLRIAPFLQAHRKRVPRRPARAHINRTRLCVPQTKCSAEICVM